MCVFLRYEYYREKRNRLERIDEKIFATAAKSKNRRRRVLRRSFALGRVFYHESARNVSEHVRGGLNAMFWQKTKRRSRERLESTPKKGRVQLRHLHAPPIEKNSRTAMIASINRFVVESTPRKQKTSGARVVGLPPSSRPLVFRCQESRMGSYYSTDIVSRIAKSQARTSREKISEKSVKNFRFRSSSSCKRAIRAHAHIYIFILYRVL